MGEGGMDHTHARVRSRSPGGVTTSASDFAEARPYGSRD